MAVLESSRIKVQQMYVAYYGRPGDPAGVEFWVTVLEDDGGDISTIVSAFGDSQEYLNGIGSGTTEEQVTSLYQQMFNRDPEQEGLDFWVSVIEGTDPNVETRTLGEVALFIAEAAGPNDRSVLDNKIVAALYFTDQIAMNDVPYLGEDIDDAQAIIAGVTADPATINQSFAATDAWIADSIENGGESYDLTMGIDAIIGTYANDTVTGLDNNDPLSDTLTDGDTFDGAGGTDTLKILSNTVDLSLAKIEVTDVEKLVVINAKEGWESVDIAGRDFDEISVDVGGQISAGLELVNVNADTELTLKNIVASEKFNNITFNEDNSSSVGNTAVTISDVDLSANSESFAVNTAFNAADTVNTTVKLMDFNDNKQGFGGAYQHSLGTGAAMGVAVNATLNIENLQTADVFEVGLFVDQAGDSVNNITVNLTNTDNVDVWLGLDGRDEGTGNGTSTEDVVTVNLSGVANTNGQASFYSTDAETLNISVLGDSELEAIGNYYNNDDSAMGNVVVNLDTVADLKVGFWDFNDNLGETENTLFNIIGSGKVMIDRLDDGSSNLTVEGSNATGDISLYSMAEEVVSVTTGSGNDSITVGSNKTSVSTGEGNDFVDTNSKDFSLAGSAVLNGGAGYDVIAVDDGNHFDLTEANIKNFEVLNISNGRGVYDTSVVSSLKEVVAFNSINESVTINQGTSKLGLTLSAFDSNGKSVAMALKDGSGLNDVLNLSLNSVDENSDQSTDGETSAIVIAAEYEMVKLVSNATTASEDSVSGSNDALLPADYTNSVELDAADMTDLIISGNAQAEVILIDASALTVVNASANKGGVEIDLSNASITGVSFSGSDADDTVTVSDNDGHLIRGNGGADVIGLADGNDVVRYVKATDSQLRLTENEMSEFDIVADFTGGGSDHIQLFSQLNLGPNQSRFALIQKGDIGGTTAGDMQTFIGDGVDFFADSSVDRATAFADDGTNGYLFVDANNDGNFSEATDVVIQLAGVTTLAITDIQFG